MSLKSKKSGEIVQPTKVLSDKVIPIPELEEAFKIFASGFKIGALYGLNLPASYRKKEKHSAFLKWLETEEAQQQIYKLLIEADLKQKSPQKDC